MTGLEQITFPDTKDSAAVRKYLEAQLDGDFSASSEIFTEDIVFNGLLYKVNGRDAVSSGFHSFVADMVSDFRVESVTRLDASSQYIILFFSKFKTGTDTVPVVDLLTIRDDKIARVDNSFDTAKIPKIIVEDAANTSNM